jgi:hypothetical protein
VAAESEQPLTERLGPPERYAAELRAAAGLAPRTGAVPASMARTVRRLGGYLSIVDSRLGPLVGHPRLRDFLVLLRPGWWVLRGYLLAVVLAAPLDQGGLLPQVKGSGLLGLILVLALVLASIWLGRRSAALSIMRQRLIALAGGLVAVLGLVTLSDVDAYARQGHMSGVYENPYSNITDVFPYGPDGKPLTGITLYDQDGNPILLGNPERCHGYGSYRVAYPHCGPTFPLPSIPPVSATTTPETPGPAPSPS